MSIYIAMYTFITKHLMKDVKYNHFINGHESQIIILPPQLLNYGSHLHESEELKSDS